VAAFPGASLCWAAERLSGRQTDEWRRSLAPRSAERPSGWAAGRPTSGGVPWRLALLSGRAAERPADRRVAAFAARAAERARGHVPAGSGARDAAHRCAGRERPAQGQPERPLARAAADRASDFHWLGKFIKRNAAMRGVGTLACLFSLFV